MAPWRTSPRSSVSSVIPSGCLFETELEDVSFTSRLAEVFEHFAGLPLPTVAAIDGSCMGLGVGALGRGRVGSHVVFVRRVDRPGRGQGRCSLVGLVYDFGVIS